MGRIKGFSLVLLSALCMASVQTGAVVSHAPAPTPAPAPPPPVCSATPVAGALSVCISAYQHAVYASMLRLDPDSVCQAMSTLRECGCAAARGCGATVRAEYDLLLLRAVHPDCGKPVFNMLSVQSELCAHMVEVMCGTRGGVKLSDPKFCSCAVSSRPGVAVLFLALLAALCWGRLFDPG